MFSRRIFRSDMLKCVLCHDAPCSKACEMINPAEMLRSIWFDNEKTAAGRFPEESPCVSCPAPCEDMCVRPHEVPIRRLLFQVGNGLRGFIDGD